MELDYQMLWALVQREIPRQRGADEPDEHFIGQLKAQADELMTRLQTEQEASDRRVLRLELYAYVGEDELGSGEVGIKAGIVPAGYIPMVSTSRAKLDRPSIRAQLQEQANRYRKPIHLIRLDPVEEVLVIEPNFGRAEFRRGPD